MRKKWMEDAGGDPADLTRSLKRLRRIRKNVPGEERLEGGGTETVVGRSRGK